jgi:hypothetical protein
MDKALQKRLQDIYRRQAEMSMGHGLVGSRKPRAKKAKAPAHHMAGMGAVGGMYHPYIHPYAPHMMGQGLVYSHPDHPYYHQRLPKVRKPKGGHMDRYGYGPAGVMEVHHRHHVPKIHEAHHPSQYAMYVKKHSHGVRAHLASSGLTGRDLNTAVFREIGRMWRSEGH